MPVEGVIVKYGRVRFRDMCSKILLKLHVKMY